jgi:hypothetical protein
LTPLSVVVISFSCFGSCPFDLVDRDSRE